MHLKEILSFVSATAAAVYAWYIKWRPNIDPIIANVEQRALDGKIDRADRKAVAMDFIQQAQASGKFKMGLLTQLLMPFLVDFIANQLPDSDVSKIVNMLQITKKEA